MFKQVILFISFIVSVKSHADNVRLLDIIKKAIEQNYYQEVVDFTFLKQPINLSLQKLDKNAFYVPESELKEMDVFAEGELSGVGIELTQKKGTVLISKVIKNSPAFFAGLKKGEAILSVDGVRIHQAYKASMMIRGEENTNVVLQLEDSFGKERKVRIVRKKFDIDQVEYRLMDDNILLLKINSFTNTTPKKIINLLKEYSLKNQEICGIILDLRGNGGGLLNSAVKVSSIFLDKGKVVEIRGRNRSAKYFVEERGFKENNTPLVVLVDERSASAAEVVAGALKDHRRAVLLGNKTFGKGTVQEIIEIEKLGALKLTTALYFRPNGNKIESIGIKPDIHISRKGSVIDEAKRVLKENEKR